MTIQGPFLSGGVSRNNQFSVSITPTVNIPADAMIWIIAGTNVADTANVAVTDSAGNVYVIQSFVQIPGIAGTILVAQCAHAIAVPTSGSITIASDIRGNWDANSYYHTGAQGSIFSTDVEFVDTSTAPSATCVGRPGMTLFGTLAVAGPSADGFTPDANWSADQKGSINRTNVTIHASGRSALLTDPDFTHYTYAPVLGTARRSLIFVASFL